LETSAICIPEYTYINNLCMHVYIIYTHTHTHARTQTHIIYIDAKHSPPETSAAFDGAFATPAAFDWAFETSAAFDGAFETPVG
jgi:hypothetical protein